MKQITLLTGIFITLFFSSTMAQTNPCETDAKGILNGPSGEIFQTEYNTYTADAATLATGNFEGVSIKVVLGNWCSDSQREVPRLFKILENPTLKNVAANYYLVNEDKFCPDPEVQKLEANYVPAIIFYRGGKELGRIVETPEGTLEANAVKIVK